MPESTVRTRLCRSRLSGTLLPWIVNVFRPTDNGLTGRSWTRDGSFSTCGGRHWRIGRHRQGVCRPAGRHGLGRHGRESTRHRRHGLDRSGHGRRRRRVGACGRSTSVARREGRIDALVAAAGLGRRRRGRVHHDRRGQGTVRDQLLGLRPGRAGGPAAHARSRRRPHRAAQLDRRRDRHPVPGVLQREQVRARGLRRGDSRTRWRRSGCTSLSCSRATS